MRTPFDREFPTALYRERTSGHLRVANRLYPQAWRQIEELRAKQDELGGWPAWCYCPLAGAYAVVCAQHGVPDLDGFARAQLVARDAEEAQRSPTLDIARIGGLAAWRGSQGIFAIAPEVLDAVLETPVNGAIPVEVLLTLPQWCVYVATPGHAIGDREIYGFFAFLERDSNHGNIELRLLIDWRDWPSYHGLEVDVLHIEPGLTLDQSYSRTLDRAAEEFRKRVSLPQAGYDRAEEVLRTQGAGRLGPLLSALFYLCCQTAEYRPGGATAFSRPSNPEARKTKAGWRLFPPDQPQIWYVGERLGRAIAEARAIEPAEPGNRAGPRPHVRRAHWHGFWTGPRTGPRTFQLRWLPPIAVALAEDTPEARIRHEALKPIRDLDGQIAAVKNELEDR